jgi:hypothetical protein
MAVDVARRVLRAPVEEGLKPEQVRQQEVRRLAVPARREGWPEIPAEEWLEAPQWLVDDPGRR